MYNRGNMNSLRTPNLSITSATYRIPADVINDAFTDLEYGRTLEFRYDSMGSTFIRQTSAMG